VAPKENLSVSEMINVFLETVDKKVHIVFNNQYEGQLRKDGDNAQLLKLLGEFEFTPFREGIKKTYDWYNENE
jgi:GDP-L-fucose synthase